jgi:hypothetical protein
MLRAPTWSLVLLLLVIVGLSVYAYFTTPLPFGLSNVIRTPGGSATPSAPSGAASPGTRTQAGQPLVLGAANLAVQSVQRNQDVSDSERGPAGSFTIVQLEIQNGGNEPLSPQAQDFRLIDDRARSYAVDVEATRAVNLANRRRLAFEASVPPAGRMTTMLAFETPPDIGALTLRVRLGYGDLELAR